jgi:hypothetical protein
MATQDMINSFFQLYNSTKVENIEIALQIARTQQIEIDPSKIEWLYIHLRGPREGSIIGDQLSHKIRVINSYSKVSLIVRDGNLDVNIFRYLGNIREVSIKFETVAISYSLYILNWLLSLEKLEKITIQNYRLRFLPSKIETLRNLKELEVHSFYS